MKRIKKKRKNNCHINPIMILSIQHTTLYDNYLYQTWVT